MHRTGAIEFGLWPTVTSVQRDHPERVEKLKATGATTMMSRKAGENRPNSVLDMAMFVGLLPTPTAMMDEAPIEKVDARNKKQMEKGNSPFILGLGQQAMRGMLPTPVAQDGKDSTLPPSQSLRTSLVGMLCTPTAQASRGNTSDKRGKGNLTDQIAELELTTGKTSQLNPRFVAEMMGFPPNWTELPFLSGETNQSKPTETQ
jgi:hypothetical protein